MYDASDIEIKIAWWNNRLRKRTKGNLSYNLFTHTIYIYQEDLDFPEYKNRSGYKRRTCAYIFLKHTHLICRYIR
jgi:hypothetical protein